MDMQQKGPSRDISWTTDEAHNAYRSGDWFWTVAGISLAVAVAALLVHNWLFSILVLLAGGTIILNALKKPGPISCSVGPHGVVVNKQFFPYNNLTSFWIEEEGYPTLILQVDGSLVPRVWIPIAPEINLPRLRETLERHLPEKRHEKTVAEILGERLGI